tara:strand:- start:460 stop:561 length:102 start_codon:yes stop_codon:yes gene_type:complete
LFAKELPPAGSAALPHETSVIGMLKMLARKNFA